ncbi:MAG: branched-chain amino acid ABC transporter permease [Immundisolibacterales bacterium]|nr:branched-chain amino acid ABC transporter permease [Immundisolibacterales bacterium]
MRYFLELSVNGAVAGALYALAALSFVVVYKATRIMNFALGEFIMFATATVAAGVNAMGLALVPALAFAGAGMFAVAAGFNRFVLRHLIGRPVIAMIMITIGFGAFLRAVAAFLFSGVPRDIDLPLPRGTLDVGGVLVSPHELAAAAIALALIGAVSWFFARTRSGVALRCVADDNQAALAMGIDVRAAFTLVWGLAGLVAVAAGVLWTYITGGGFNMVLVGLKVFPIVIIGGLDSIAGVIVGAMLIGWIEAVAAGYLDPIIGGGVSHVTSYLLLIAMLLVRPWGLFGREAIDRP